jgi:hypothetical protein
MEQSIPHGFFGYIGFNLTENDTYSKKFMIDTIKDLDLFWVDNQFTHDRYNMTPRINP